VTEAIQNSSIIQKAGRYRWTIIALLFFATTINYIDRTMFGLFKADLSKEFSWTEDDYGNIVTAFQAAYAIGFLVMGRLIDKYGPKIGYFVAIVIWTIGHVMHGIPEVLGSFLKPIAATFGGSSEMTASALMVLSFMLARVVLGIGEAGHFPTVVRASSEWFPQKERSYAIGWVNSATTIGVILTAPTIWIFKVIFDLEWRDVFLYSGLFGVILLGLWVWYYSNPRESGRVSDAELAWIEHDPPEKVEQVGWLKLVTKREAWAFALAKFFTDPVWFFFLFWLPGYFKEAYQVDLKTVLLPMIIMYLISDVGSIVGGWISSKLIQSGRTPNFARKVTMIFAGLCVLPLLTVTMVGNMWAAVFIIGLALAGHQAFSSNLLSLPPDMFPKRAVGSVIGLGGFMGGIGGMIMAKSVGLILDATDKNYALIFAACTVVYFLAVLVIHLLSPRLELAKL
jgi:MFS transporter, ACS family, hexuronate transporter